MATGTISLKDEISKTHEIQQRIRRINYLTSGGPKNTQSIIKMQMQASRREFLLDRIFTAEKLISSYKKSLSDLSGKYGQDNLENLNTSELECELESLNEKEVYSRIRLKNIEIMQKDCDLHIVNSVEKHKNIVDSGNSLQLPKISHKNYYDDLLLQQVEDIEEKCNKYKKKYRAKLEELRLSNLNKKDNIEKIQLISFILDTEQTLECDKAEYVMKEIKLNRNIADLYELGDMYKTLLLFSMTSKAGYRIRLDKDGVVRGTREIDSEVQDIDTFKKVNEIVEFILESLSLRLEDQSGYRLKLPGDEIAKGNVVITPEDLEIDTSKIDNDKILDSMQKSSTSLNLENKSDCLEDKAAGESCDFRPTSGKGKVKVKYSKSSSYEEDMLSAPVELTLNDCVKDAVKIAPTVKRVFSHNCELKRGSSISVKDKRYNLEGEESREMYASESTSGSISVDREVTKIECVECLPIKRMSRADVAPTIDYGIELGCSKFTIQQISNSSSNIIDRQRHKLFFSCDEINR